MNPCEDIRALLDDYLDGDLDDLARQRVEGHLSACPSCRREVDELERLLRRAAALPRALTPRRDLWPGVASRLGGRGSWTGLAAAAALLAAAGLAGWLVSSPPQRPGRSAGPGAVVPAAAPPPANLAGAAAGDMRRASFELRRLLDEHRGRLAPETVRVVESNLAVIENAVDEIEAALEGDPASPALRRMLTAALQQEAYLLQQLTRVLEHGASDIPDSPKEPIS